MSLSHAASYPTALHSYRARVVSDSLAEARDSASVSILSIELQSSSTLTSVTRATSNVITNAPFSVPTARDPVIIERSNLVNISKLIVKELIETSLKYGRMLDSDHMPLQHFFIVLEHVLRHGLRPKKVKTWISLDRAAVICWVIFSKTCLPTCRVCSAPRRSCGISCSWSKSIVQRLKIWRRAFAIYRPSGTCDSLRTLVNWNGQLIGLCAFFKDCYGKSTSLAENGSNAEKIVRLFEGFNRSQGWTVIGVFRAGCFDAEWRSHSRHGFAGRAQRDRL